MQQKSNWPAMFTAYTQGHPLKEIAQSFGVSLDVLIDHSEKQNWRALRDMLPLATSSLAAVPVVEQPARNPFDSVLPMVQCPAGAEVPTELKRKFEELLENRRHNLTQAHSLRADADKILADLAAGTLQIEQITPGKDAHVVSRDLNMQDRVALVTYVRMIHDLTYKALGDSASAGPGGDGKPPATPPPAITIFMPGIVSKPRTQPRSARGTIDITSNVVSKDESHNG